MKFLQLHNKPALAFKNQIYSYQELLQHAGAYASLLKSYNPRKVIIYSENRPEWLFSFFGSWLQKAIVVPVDVMSTALELNYIIGDCQPDVLFCSAEKKNVVDTALENLSVKPECLVFENLPELAMPEQMAEVEVDDLQKTALIIYTSGTTGNPKGVMLSFENLYANIKAVSSDIHIFGPEETVMILLPLHHVLPLVGSMLAPFFVGGRTAMSPSLNTEDILSTLQQHQVSIIIGVPRLYTLIRNGVKNKINASKIGKAMFWLASKLNSRSFSQKIFKAVHQKFGGHVKYMVSGGAALDPEVARDYRTLGFEILDGYGMTEAAPMISFTRPGHWKIGYPGQVMPGATVEIRDGEIVASGKNIMQGYYNQPQETAETVKDGWLYTGDLGELDKNGYLKITGRKKEIIVTSGGKKINPATLETELEETISGIAEVGVTLHKEKLHAVVFPDFEKLKSDGITDLTAYFRDQLTERFNNQVAPYKKILAFTIVNAGLPRTRLGKIQRFKLDELIEAPLREKAAKAQPDFEEFKIIQSYLQEQKSVDVLPDDHLEFDLGLDSLDKVGLQTWLEKSFGVHLKPEHMMNFPSVQKLAEFIREKKNRLHFEKINWSDILKEKVHFKLPGSWFVSQMILKFSKYVYKVYFRLKYSGLNNIPDGPCIIAPNHQSYFDGFIVASLLERQTFSRTCFYTKEKHVKWGWLKYLAHHNNIIIVDLNNDLRLSIQKMAGALQNNRNIMIFPEGTRTKDGTIGQFKDTFAILSRELGVPVVPVAIDGTWHALPRGSYFPKPFKEINVTFLEPIYPASESYQSISSVVRNKIMGKLIA